MPSDVAIQYLGAFDRIARVGFYSGAKRADRGGMLTRPQRNFVFPTWRSTFVVFGAHTDFGHGCVVVTTRRCTNRRKAKCRVSPSDRPRSRLARARRFTSTGERHPTLAMRPRDTQRLDTREARLGRSYSPPCKTLGGIMMGRATPFRGELELDRAVSVSFGLDQLAERGWTVRHNLESPAPPPGWAGRPERG